MKKISLLLSAFGLIISNVSLAQTANTFTATNASISDTLFSGGVIKAQCIHANDTIRANDDIIALQNVNVAGNINLAGSLIFEPINAVGFKYLPANTINNPFPVISFGKASSQILPVPPICPIPGNYNNAWILTNGGFMSHYSSGLINGGLKFYVAPWNGFGHIEVEGTNAAGADQNALSINYFCGRETQINLNSSLPNEGGWVKIGNNVNMRKHVEIGDPVYGITNAPNNDALSIFANDGRGLVLKTNNTAMKLLTVENTNLTKSPFTVYADGKTIIGLQEVVGIHAGALLQVAGKAACQSFYVLKTTTWQDRVFNEDYELMDLASVKKYIIKNKHLPGIPSEKEVLEEGYDVNEMDAKLMEKIENLYLYIIKQQEEIETLKKALKKTNDN